MRFEIVKCHGSGNDFPLIDARGVELSDAQWAEVARALADRAGPVGGDGLLLLTDTDHHHAFGMRMFNSDGSEAETCLNGLRCVARAGFEALGIERATVRLKTSAVEVARAADLAPGVYTVRETAGPVLLDASGWLKSGEHEHVEAAIAGLPSERRFTALSIGNPHLVAFVDAVDEAELVALGEWIEAAPALIPGRANLSFVTTPQSGTLRGPQGEERGPGTIFVRTFERGVGLTDSCGSAMAASSYAACLTGRAAFGEPLTVLNAGGRVGARAESDGMVTVEGNATFEWRGTVEVVDGRATLVAVGVRYAGEVAAWAGVTA